jgi:hypothetical protein
MYVHVDGRDSLYQQAFDAALSSSQLPTRFTETGMQRIILMAKEIAIKHAQQQTQTQTQIQPRTQSKSVVASEIESKYVQNTPSVKATGASTPNFTFGNLSSSTSSSLFGNNNNNNNNTSFSFGTSQQPIFQFGSQ